MTERALADLLQAIGDLMACTILDVHLALDEALNAIEGISE